MHDDAKEREEIKEKRLQKIKQWSTYMESIRK